MDNTRYHSRESTLRPIVVFGVAFGMVAVVAALWSRPDAALIWVIVGVAYLLFFRVPFLTLDSKITEQHLKAAYWFILRRGADL